MAAWPPWGCPWWCPWGGLRPARAAEAFPASQALAGVVLLRNGIATRRYLGVEVYRAALYLPRPERDPAAILATPAPALVLLRYTRAVPAEAAAAAWRQSWQENAGEPPPAALLAWIAGALADDEERYACLDQGARLSGPRRPEPLLPGLASARALLANWLGPKPPTEALKRGLLGAT